MQKEFGIPSHRFFQYLQLQHTVSVQAKQTKSNPYPIYRSVWTRKDLYPPSVDYYWIITSVIFSYLAGKDGKVILGH